MTTQTTEPAGFARTKQERLQRELAVWKSMYDRLSYRMLEIERERDELRRTLNAGGRPDKAARHAR